MRKIKKVLLLTPPADTFKDCEDINPIPPLGLAYIGAVLENRGLKVKIVDCLVEGWYNHRVKIGNNRIRIGLPLDKIKEIIRDYRPDMVGVSNLLTTQRENAGQIYRLAKEVDKNIITVAGGAHPTVLPELVLSDKNVDYVVIGEGEKTMLDLIDYIEGKEDISALDGVGYKENGKIKIIPKTKFIEDLDKLSFPARHLLNMEGYVGIKASHGFRKKKRWSPIVTSRGCPMGCTFCSAHKVWGKRFRMRSPENVIAEMRELKDKYKIEEIMFEDDNTTLNVPRAEKIFDLMIKEKLNFVWDTPNGIAAYTLTERLLDKIKAAGCYRLNLAIESGSQYVLDNIIKKPLNLEKVKSIVEYAKKIKLHIGAFLIVGLPGEKESQMKESFEFVDKLGIYGNHVNVCIATPYPGTELYKISSEKGYLKKDFSLDDLFIHGFSISTEDWDEEKLKKIHKEGMHFLRVSALKRHPFKFFKEYFTRYYAHPLIFIRRSYEFILGKGSKFGEDA